jgi:hypothetical protein
LFPVLLFWREDLFRLILFLLRPKPSRLRKARTGTSSTTSPPPAHSAEPSLDKKRKHVEELLSLSTYAPKNAAGEASAPDDDVEIFDLLDS